MITQSAHGKNTTLKIGMTALCLLVAAGLFYFLKSDAKQEALVLVPVEFAGLPDDLIISTSSTNTIEILVKGEKKSLDSFKSPVFRLSLSKAMIGEKYLPVTSRSVELPKGVQILNVEPVMIRVVIDKKVSRTLPVDIVCSGLPAKGYHLEKAVAIPENVTVAGPRVLVETMDTLRTKPVDITGMSESGKKEAVYDIDPSWAIILPQGPVVAQLTFNENVVVKKIDIPLTLPVKVTHVNPTSASLEISGSENRFIGLDVMKDIEITIHVDDLKPGVYVRRANISLPVDFTLISVKPELFTLTIQ